MALHDPQALILAGIALSVAIYVVRWKGHPLRAIPTVGGSDVPVLSLLAARNLKRNPAALLSEGYKKYHNSTFKVAFFRYWLVVLAGPKMVDELRLRLDDEASFQDGIEEAVQLRSTVGQGISEDRYHVDVIREMLPRNFPVVLPDLVDELRVAVQEYIPTKGDEWTAVTVMPKMQKIIARASSRVFVGLPLCRNEDYVEMSIRFTGDIVSDKKIMELVPHFLKRFVGPLVSKAKQTISRAMPDIQPIIHERMANMQALGEDWSDKPNDMLQWLIDKAVLRNQSDVDIVKRIFRVNFAAIHTTSMTLVQVLYNLAAMPEYVRLLREEIDDAIATDGWTKAAMDKMWKLDSLLKESSRYRGLGLLSTLRKVSRDVTLSDGTFLPKGTLVATAAYPAHYDESSYDDPDIFDPFRFSKMRDSTGEGSGSRHQFASTSVDYLPFGHGKHACPGRFFVANELKAILAHIVLNYDLKPGGDGKRPADTYSGTAIIPSWTGEVLFRKRLAETP